MSALRSLLLLQIFTIAAGCASIDGPNPVSSIERGTVFVGDAGIRISIPDDRPNACPGKVDVRSLAESAQKQRLSFTQCDVACFSLSGEVVSKLSDGRAFGNCGTPDKGNWGFAGVLEENGRGVHVLKGVEFIPNTPELTRR